MFIVCRERERGDGVQCILSAGKSDVVKTSFVYADAQTV